MLAPLHIRVCGSMLVVFLRVWCDRVVGSIGLVDAAKSRTSHVRSAVSVRAVAPPGCFLSSLNGIDHGDMRGLGVSKPLSNQYGAYALSRIRYPCSLLESFCFSAWVE